MFDVFRKTLTFLIGSVIVVGGLLDECPKIAVVAIGLLLMGVFTIPEAMALVKSRIREED